MMELCPLVGVDIDPASMASGPLTDPDPSLSLEELARVVSPISSVSPDSFLSSYVPNKARGEEVGW